ncbi:LAMI_0H05974g1_1 [Lachancea mirantina]|uniref:LAMI_0H05974g1_1 n=1 Tax=Lachancea mirantina TaxID=1230905 RepID=A0A1G4KF94_9SACH|nr:LAMI_0H05974g1_1 [Lachancea mirantina]
MVPLPEWCPPLDTTKYDPNTCEELFCICKKPDSGELMVGCDGCDDWFHFKCLRIPLEYKELVFSFYCPYCQAGVTGPGAITGKLPKTVWRRKCRVSDCYRSCDENSKYCSKEHGIEYLRGISRRLDCGRYGSREVIHKMTSGRSFKQFREIGSLGLAPASRDLDPDTYDAIFGSGVFKDDLDVKMSRLIEAQRLITEGTLPTLDRYIAWIKVVNELLFSNGGAEEKGDGRTRKKARAPRGICGFSVDKKIPRDAADFVRQFHEEKETVEDLHGVCCKVRCSKHLDWTGIEQRTLQYEQESVQTSLQRIDLLKKQRNEELTLQFHEMLLRKHKICNKVGGGAIQDTTR